MCNRDTIIEMEQALSDGRSFMRITTNVHE